MLSQITSLFLLEFAVGTLAFMLFMPLRDLKKTFFLLNGGISLLFLLLFILLTGVQNLLTLKWPMTVSVLSLILSYFIYWANRDLISKAFLLISTLAGLWVLFLRGMTGMSSSLPLLAQISGSLSLILGALLLGVCYGTMILGHWYLVTPALPFRYLVNASRVFILTAVARAVGLVVTLILFFWFLGTEGKMLAENLISFDQLGLFFLMRIFWGILGPLVLSFMILETAKIRSNQAATGILYVACIFVFIGELFADYLFQMGRFPA